MGLPDKAKNGGYTVSPVHADSDPPDVSQQLGDMASFTGSCGFRPGRSFENHARFIKVLPGETGEAVGDTCGVLIRFAEEAPRRSTSPSSSR